MFFYAAYDLCILSFMPLPELIPVPCKEADVVIRKEKIGRSLPETDHTRRYFHMTEDEAYFYWEQIGAFLVRNGREIIVDPLPDLEDRLIRVFLTGIVFSAILQQRRFTTLHASAIALNGEAIAFMGEKTIGKSTLAAAFYAQGHSLVSDDSVALDMSSPGSPLVIPSFPHLKLTPDAVAYALRENVETFPKIASIYEKHACRIINRFSRGPLPLRSIYVISEDPVMEIDSLPPREAIVQIIKQSYIARVFKEYLQGAKAASHFLECAEIVERVPVYRLKRPSSLSLLPDIVRLVEEHLSGDKKRALK